MTCAYCGHTKPEHGAKGKGPCERCTCKGYIHAVTMHPREAQAVELAFVIQDPAGEAAVTLAREILRLIDDRDDATAIALISEIRVLSGKYPRRPRPHVEKN